MKVFIAMPVYRATPNGTEYTDLPGPVAASLQAARALLPGHIFKRANNGLIHRSRAELAGVFLDSDATHLLFWDSDVAIPTESLAALLLAGHEDGAGIVAIPQHFRDRRGFSVIDYDPATRTAAGCGMGAMLIARAVFERTASRHPDLRVQSLSRPGTTICAMFNPMIVGGHLIDEDYAFQIRTGERIKLLVDHEVEHDGVRGKLSEVLQP